MNVLIVYMEANFNFGNMNYEMIDNNLSIDDIKLKIKEKFGYNNTEDIIILNIIK